ATPIDSSMEIYLGWPRAAIIGVAQSRLSRQSMISSVATLISHTQADDSAAAEADDSEVILSPSYDELKEEERDEEEREELLRVRRGAGSASSAEDSLASEELRSRFLPALERPDPAFLLVRPQSCRLRSSGAKANQTSVSTEGQQV